MVFTMGRKTIADVDRKSEALTVMVTKAAKRKIELEAEERGFRSVSDYIRKEKLHLST